MLTSNADTDSTFEGYCRESVNSASSPLYIRQYKTNTVLQTRQMQSCGCFSLGVTQIKSAFNILSENCRLSITKHQSLHSLIQKSLFLSQSSLIFPAFCLQCTLVRQFIKLGLEMTIKCKFVRFTKI